ncbi:hypothetical protein, partial [Tropheryma whipplei]
MKPAFMRLKERDQNGKCRSNMLGRRISPTIFGNLQKITYTAKSHIYQIRQRYASHAYTSVYRVGRKYV